VKIVKKIVESILIYIIKALGGCISLRFTNKVAIYRDLFWSYVAKHEFKRTGTRFSLQPPYHIVGAKHISVGDKFRSFGGLRLEAIDKYFGRNYTPEITIGENVSINYNCHIACTQKISIGNNVLLASQVFISDHSHGETIKEMLNMSPLDRPLYSKGPIVIEDNVWIGEGAVILSGVTVGHNAVIGANAVVTHDIEPFTVVGGIPARVLRSFNQNY
jgi:acetyltransferase-like isoleucine patch superfamily enzyme